ncbi:hypothetical protein RJ640_030380 [Escallonia rubra]|uniref:Purple acid phosphatase C-terminal domain-containing protein n=1 Tax=Escallonia rubra TaxID=112253 RepID=A0AA88QZN0_9ASTE|nr:hypothetical protein RJ640_030380 [Escallonia rubra]
MPNKCVNSETSHYSGTVNGTIHVVAGGGGSHLSAFSPVNTTWSLYKDYDFGFVKLTAFNHSSLLFEYKKSSDGKVYDSFTISRDYRDVLACVHDGCEATTSANSFEKLAYIFAQINVLYKNASNLNERANVIITEKTSKVTLTEWLAICLLYSA